MKHCTICGSHRFVQLARVESVDGYIDVDGTFVPEEDPNPETTGTWMCLDCGYEEDEIE